MSMYRLTYDDRGVYVDQDEDRQWSVDEIVERLGKRPRVEWMFPSAGCRWLLAIRKREAAPTLDDVARNLRTGGPINWTETDEIPF